MRLVRRAVSTRLARTLGSLLRSRPAEVAWPGGAVSFTFDDFPRSALAAGGAVLEKYGVRGTYYAALGRLGSDGNIGRLCDADDIREAHARGHELGCHTHSHMDCSAAASAAILADVADNRAAFAGLLENFVPVSFAYPFGAMSLAAKRALAPRFQSCRGVGGGIHSGTADLADLRGTRIYHREYDRAGLLSLIDRNRELGGWLIFYTHDVAPAPSAYGCTPDELEAVVADAAKRSQVLPVREVVARLRPAP